jgi:CHASE3 domain sensor protein
MPLTLPKETGAGRWRVAGARAATTPGLLKAALAATWLLALVFLLAVRSGVEAHRQGMQTIGKDSASSIVAAQHIKASLADMHASAAGYLLTKPGQDRQAARDYEKRRLEVTDGLLAAAGNITYGDAERVPLRQIVNALGQYEETVARARALHDAGADGALLEHRAADRVMHETLLPAADALDRANRQALNDSYAAQRRTAGWSLAWLILSGLGLLAVLAATQAFLYRRMRRLLNPALLGATAVAAVFLVHAVNALRAEGEALRATKQDCFDSIDVLEQARADAYDLQGYQRRRLLDPQTAEVSRKGFADKAGRLVSLSQGLSSDRLLAAVDKLRPDELRPQLVRDKLPHGFEGHLATELYNITFDGEQEVAVDELKAFFRCTEIDHEVQKLEQEGQRDEAVALCLGTKAGQSAWAFARLEEALGKTLAINQREFDRAVERGFQAVAGFGVSAPLAAAAVALLAYLGLLPRMKEYDA